MVFRILASLCVLSLAVVGCDYGEAEAPDQEVALEVDPTLETATETLVDEPLGSEVEAVEETAPEPFDEPNNAPKAPGATEYVLSASGTVIMTTTSTDCEDGNEGSGVLVEAEVLVVGDDVTVNVSLYPQVTGKLLEGRALVVGDITWMEGVEEILCSVQGGVKIGEGEVTINLAERLSTGGETICDSKTELVLPY